LARYDPSESFRIFGITNCDFARQLGKGYSAGGPRNDPDFKHHKGEIKAMLDRAVKLAKRLPRKALEEIMKHKYARSEVAWG
jgi:hypothetical protein